MNQLKNIKIRIAIWLTILAVTVLCFSSMLIKYSTCRAGFRLNDFLINYFIPINLSTPIFVLTYGSLAVCLLLILKKITLFERAIVGYLLITVARISFLYFIPLAPPLDIIPLDDPILEASAYQGQKICIDLFFSGHISTMVLFALLIDNSKIKYAVFITALIVALMLVIQHVHYTADVLFAPLFSAISYYLSKKICEYFY